MTALAAATAISILRLNMREILVHSKSQLDEEIKRLDEARERIRLHWMAEEFDAERGNQYAAELEKLTDQIIAVLRARDKEVIP